MCLLPRSKSRTAAACLGRTQEQTLPDEIEIFGLCADQDREKPHGTDGALAVRVHHSAAVPKSRKRPSLRRVRT